MSAKSSTMLVGRVVVLACLAVVVAAGRDFYGILGVSRGATTKEIKRQYRKLASKLHPDKNPDNPDATRQFQDLSAAYEVLSNAEQRRVYDQRGEEGLQQSNARGSSMHSMFRPQHREHETPRGDTLVLDLDVTLEQLFKGDYIEFLRHKHVVRDAPGTRNCRCRQETRTVQVAPGRFQMTQHRVCDQCPNVRLEDDVSELEVEVEAGMSDGQEIVFFGEGEPHIDGDPGDLKFRIRTLPHQTFHRVGDDLYTNMSITLPEALLGFSKTLTHLDEIVQRNMVQPGSTLALDGEGMPNYENPRRGSLFVTFEVIFPSGALLPEDAKEIERIFGSPSAELNVYNAYYPASR